MEQDLHSSAPLREVLGYLNFSSGNPDAKFLRNLNQVITEQLADRSSNEPRHLLLRDLLLTGLQSIQQTSSAFADTSQASAVIDLTLNKLLPAYLEFHSDLLFHRNLEDLAQPLFLGRMFEAVLQERGASDDERAVLAKAISRLNDFIGYRPIAVLENDQKVEPYEHEWVRPIPLYVQGAGVAYGRYQQLIEETLRILRATDPEILAQAFFDPELLDELAVDPRGYDFDHPVNRRPNYHFGQWDPNHIDNKGQYRRFVLQQVTLDALLVRLENISELRSPELLTEAATVLAGTILMASGTSGSSPDSHDSSVSLATLLPRIASYRDAFYERAIEQLPNDHAERLISEAKKLRQPFGGARQHLNQELAKQRATQLQHIHLAQLYARMGYPDAAMREAQSVKVASARMMCEIYCLLTLGHRTIDNQSVEIVASFLPEIEDLLYRAIHCGALVDPWNIVGFGGNFSVFSSLENSIHDYRVDGLIELVEQIFALCARAWSEAAAQDNAELEKSIEEIFSRLAAWWDKFATPAVESIKRLVGKEQEVSTNLVAGALNAWHKAGAAAGDIGFWRMFVDQFDTPKAFQLVVEALMEKKDLVASMALLMQWLSQTPRIPLQDGDSSFHRLAIRWICELEGKLQQEQGSTGPAAEHAASQPAERPQDRTTETEQGIQLSDPAASWQLVKKLFDYLEANAESYWNVPRLDLAGIEGNSTFEEDPFHATDEEDQQEEDYLFSAAYEEMTYRDSTDDNFDGDMLETPSDDTNYELEHEAKRIIAHLEFLNTLAALWKHAAVVWGSGKTLDPQKLDAFGAWQQQASSNHAGLLELLETVHGHQLTCKNRDHESLLEYDRKQMIKEHLLDRIINTCAEVADAERFLCATCHPSSDQETGHTVAILHAILSGEIGRVRSLWPKFLAEMRCRSILYVPISRGGTPSQIVAARATQQTIHDLLVWLPRLGLLEETCVLLQTAQAMENEHPVGPGAVTEYDRLFETGYKSIIESIVASADTWDTMVANPDSEYSESRHSDSQLVECLQQFTEAQLQRWFRHSRTLRLSVVEKLSTQSQWNEFIEFIEENGHDLFTQKFLNLGNLRAILHQGVDAWLAHLEEDPEAVDELKLLRTLQTCESRQKIVRYLTIALEAIMENYAEYRDYNSTTTQSDRGELLYTLIDFIRLRSEYDRIAWNLRPVVLAHEILVRRQRTAAADLWSQAIAERTAEAADRHLQRLNELCSTYGMRLPTIADRIAERFVRPLTIDRVRALIRPAMQVATEGESNSIFTNLEQEIASLAREPSGVGYDMPAWLVAMEQEVSVVRQAERQGNVSCKISDRIPFTLLSIEKVQAQLDSLSGED